MITIKYRNIVCLKRFEVQILIIAFFVIWDLIYYALHMNYLNLFYIDSNSTSETLELDSYCDFNDEEARLVFAWTDFLNYTMLPFLIMILCSILIIHSIYQSRKRVSVTNRSSKLNKNELNRIKRDIQFSFVIIMLNISFFLFNAPICMYSFFSLSGDLLYFSLNLVCYLQYDINIFIYLMFNEQFKNKFVKLFCWCSRKTDGKNENTGNFKSDTFKY